eukprot:TRINITY_DN38739_c0_g1_i1.p1 TRINITY_DN38739_c0_g1~~TRINITY_DN38739_c0_g1_i1.p1  ORF type:complete len:310 (-),score=54.96 TRINITY_DN38739_c0_g1_i1:145-1035(-)
MAPLVRDQDFVAIFPLEGRSWEYPLSAIEKRERILLIRELEAGSLESENAALTEEIKHLKGKATALQSAAPRHSICSTTASSAAGSGCSEESSPSTAPAPTQGQECVAPSTGAVGEESQDCAADVTLQPAVNRRQSVRRWHRRSSICTDTEAGAERSPELARSLQSTGLPRRAALVRVEIAEGRFRGQRGTILWGSETLGTVAVRTDGGLHLPFVRTCDCRLLHLPPQLFGGRRGAAADLDSGADSSAEVALDLASAPVAVVADGARTSASSIAGTPVLLAALLSIALASLAALAR